MMKLTFPNSSLPPFGARYYHSARSLWLSADPLADKYPNLSPYSYCADNPVRLKDEDGREIEVVQNDNGTYTVTGGTLNKNRNIYIVKDGKRTGKILGQTMTDYSFFNEEGNVVRGAIINSNDNSGQSFLNDIKIKDPSLINYIYNGRHGTRYDFKTQGTIQDGMSLEQHMYRGMPLKDAKGNIVYGTARDVGNYAAGYVSARNGLSWDLSRLGFDAYETGFSNLIHKKWTPEAMVSQSAQRLGFSAGKLQRDFDRRLKYQNGLVVPHLRR